MSRYVYYIIPLLAGAVMMVVEVLGFRLLAPYFGYSVYVFGSLIGVVLAALAVGYWVGGVLADRNTPTNTIGALLLGATCYLALGAWLYQPLLAGLSRLGLITGALIATTVLFLPPLVVLAVLSPYLVRMRATGDGKPVGISAGNVAAWGTVGSIVGTFATSFYFLPQFGTRTTFIVAVAATAAVTFPFFTSKRLRVLVLVPLVAAVGIKSTTADAQVVHARESLYSMLEVVDYGNFLGLRTERRSGTIQTFYTKPGTHEHFLLYDLFALPPLVTGGTNTLLLGLAGGSIPRVHEQFGQHIRTTGVELDPDVVELGKEYFHLDEVQNLSIHIADARPFIAASGERFDIVEIDLFGGGVDIPFYATTREFFSEVAKHLVPQGMAAINVYDPSPERMLVGPVANTMAAVFADVTLVDAGGGSYFIMASDEPISLVDRPEVAQPIRTLLTYAREHAQPVTFDGNILVLTDDRAPIEQLTYGSMAKFR